MVTVAIVGILASVAYPSYLQYVVRSNRAAAQSFLLEVSAIQGRFLVDTEPTRRGLLRSATTACPLPSPPITRSPSMQSPVSRLGMF
ncbi:hypothetical protein PO002_43640 [Cupriavidus necator]|uniref:type IV pilin protein n=1 Tax=Cupriavidus necator TaxID=106590 RepID=UPI0039C1D44A